MPSPDHDAVAVLASGGLDSAVLMADLAAARSVFPLYLCAGLSWEQEERTALARFIAALGDPNIHAVTELAVPAAPLLGEHWSVTGQGLPAAGTPDSAVFIPGRNVILIGLAAVWCSTHAVGQIAIGSLGSNPFPDASIEFFDDYAAVLSRGLDHPIQIIAPYRNEHKEAILKRFQHLPLELTVTCMRASDGVHCGNCNKCEERRQAFQRAGVTDRTRYQTRE
ncbi:MAG: 7-cyano-7-deazaguanine synthase [Dehalococcoidia bacterium]|nr:7-cyano-7-deazaguanine synthase [Dehalococcoidia bacterium]